MVSAVSCILREQATLLLERTHQGLDSSIPQILEKLSVAGKCQNQIDPVTLIEKWGVKHDRQ